MPILALDTETTGLDPLVEKVILLQIGNPTKQFIVDCRTVSLEPLRPILESKKPKILHNAKFDYKMIKSCFNIEVENMVDTMLIEQILTNGKEKVGLSLRDLAQRYLGLTMDKSERDSFIRHQGEFSSSQLEYAARDVINTYVIAMQQLPLLRKDALEETARLECLAINAFGDLEMSGILLDKGKWSVLVQDAKQKRDLAKMSLDEQFQSLLQTNLFGGVEINYDSEHQLKDALTKLGVSVADTNRNTLLQIKHPVIECIFEYREQQKIVGTYGDGFIRYIHPKTGRIHPEFRQLGAESGRVSCTKPNLQNVPAGSAFRSCFIAPKPKKIITADYSGCELRILAELSRDPVFVDTFRNNQDLHSIVATQMFRKPVSKKENKELRDRAKVINFGLAYGMGAQALALTLNASPREAETLLRDYFRNFPKIKEYLENSARVALSRGYAETIGGRKRYFHIPNGEDKAARAAIERQAKNMPIQGCNADMIKLALILVRDEFKQRKINAKLVNTVHDEMVVECDSDMAEEVASIIKHKMLEAGEHYLKTIPIEVEFTIADHWSK